MAKIAIRHLAELPLSENLRVGVSVEGPVEVRAALERPGDPVHLHHFHMGAGGIARWHGLSHDCALYVWEGAVEVEGRLLGKGSVFIVEHGASTQARAMKPARLLAFAASDACVSAPRRAGGQVHLLSADRVPRCADFHGDGRVGGALFADSACPTCEIWLHETTLHVEGFETPLHSHSEDEVIVVTAGEIILGRRAYGAGTVVAIARNTLYAFKSGKSGLSFINFRPTLPVYVPADRSQPVIDERRSFLRNMPPPVADMIRRPAAVQ